MFKCLIQLTLKIISNIFTKQFNEITYISLIENVFVTFREVGVVKLIKMNYFEKDLYIRKRNA